MAVYVDPPLHKYGRMIMCHMWADTLDELHKMADRIGVSRRWLQQPPKASWVHYDISKGKRDQAVRYGAIEKSILGPLIHLAEKAGDQVALQRYQEAEKRRESYRQKEN